VNYLTLHRSALAIRPYRERTGDGHRTVLITDARALSADDTVRTAQLASFDCGLPLRDVLKHPTAGGLAAPIRAAASESQR
jgi:hypothetical protein